MILSASWDFYFRYGKADFERALADTLTTLAASHERVVVLGVIPRLLQFDRECAVKALKLPFLDCTSLGQVTPQTSTLVNARLRKLAEAHGVGYVDFNEVLCDEETCSGYLGTTPLYFDRSHLSVRGAELLGEQLVARGSADRVLAALGQMP